MSTYPTMHGWDSDTEDSGADLDMLHRAYMTSIHQHRVLVGDLCMTLARLGAAIESAAMSPEERVALVAGIDRHVDQARGIVACIDTALTRAAIVPMSAPH